MKKLKTFLSPFLTLIFIVFMGYKVKSGYILDQECFVNNPNYPQWVLFDLSYRLPDGNGQFDNGTTGWTSSTTAGSQVISYSDSTQGWVGLRCTAGSTCSIECGSISVSTANLGATHQPSYDWDQIFMCLHFRGCPTYNSQLAGRFQVEFYDAANSQVYTALAYDASSIALYSDKLPRVGLDIYGNASDTTWSDLLWGFTPPHQNWYRISKIKISYSVPTSGFYSIPTTEVQIDQMYIDTAWTKKSP